MKFNFTKGKNKSTELAIRMALSLVLALLVGTAFILLRESLIANDKLLYGILLIIFYFKI